MGDICCCSVLKIFCIAYSGILVKFAVGKSVVIYIRSILDWITFHSLYHLESNAPLTFSTQQIFEITTNSLQTAEQNKNSSFLLFEWFIHYIFLRWQHFFVIIINNKKKTMYVNKLASNSAMKICCFFVCKCIIHFLCIFLRKLKNITQKSLL